MKIFSRIVCLLLVSVMVLPMIPLGVFAQEEETSIYSIQNDYLKFTINAETGGFSVETLDGNPQKATDNDIPLLYKEDEERSNGTSFTTVRIDGKDYVFGRNYGFFGIESHLHTPVVSNEGRLITVEWDIYDYTVVKEVALSAENDQDLTGNVGISYKVINHGTKDGNVGIRVLLDTALDSTVDAPYFVKDTDISTVNVETEFRRDNGTMPEQIRGVDSVTNPSKMLYTFTKAFSDTAAEVDRIVLGHWRNLANTRYDYTADEYCDFTNYSNSHRTPDAAIAYYWDERPLAAGTMRTAEIMYGVGNFSESVEKEGIGINMSIDNKIRLNDKSDGYVNNGEFTVTVVVDNSVTGATTVEGAVVAVSFDDGISLVSETAQASFDVLNVGDVKTLQFKLKAEKQQVITAKTVGITLTGNQDIEGTNTARVVTLNTSRSLVVPGISGSYPDIRLSHISPEIVFTEGDKTVTVTGTLSPLKAIEGNEGWKLFLYHTTTDHKVEIEKKRIAFINDEYTQLTFTTDEELSVGEYEIGFEFTAQELVNGFGVTAIKLGKNLSVSNNPIYRTRSYSLMALVRYDKTKYTFVPFADQNEYNNFLDGLSRTGSKYTGDISAGYPDINGNMIAPFDPVDTDKPETMLVDNKEIILIMRGAFKENTEEDGTKYYQALKEDADITINEILKYTGDEPLVLKQNGGIYSVSGDGDIGVIGSIDVWSGKWSFQVNSGTVTTLDADRCNLPNPNELELALGGVGYMVQSLGGFLIDIKYGVMTSSRPVDSDRTLIYGISFGGSISIPIKIPSTSKKSTNDGGGQDGGQGGGQTPAQKDAPDTKKDTAENEIKKSEDDDYSDILTSMFDEDKAAAELKAAEKAKRSKPETDFKKDTNLDSGLLTAAINDVRFGQEAEEQDDGSVKITDTGFIGIDAYIALGLPKDVLGNLITNAPGVYAALTINTIDHFYMLEAGLDIKMIQCEGVLSFAMTDVKGVDVVVPDSVQFYIRDGLKIPIVPPVLYLSGLGGGFDGLADTIGGEFSKLPPLAVMLFARFDLVEILVGDFNAQFSLTGISLEGEFAINVGGLMETRKNSNVAGSQGGTGGQGGTGKDQGTDKDQGTGKDQDAGINGAKESPKNPANRSSFANSVINLAKSPAVLNIGASCRWITPANFKGYGSVSIIDGLLTGGISITISKDSFYGYAHLSLCIPESIPIIGGKELAGVEAALSDKFVGANLKILGIKLGFIYYWGGKFSIGTGINLSGVGALEYPEYEAEALYGTNLHKLSKKRVDGGIELFAAEKQLAFEFDNIAGQDAIVVEIPFEAIEYPDETEFSVYDPDGNKIALTPDDGNGGGNYLFQTREGKNYIYISVTDRANIKDGTWKVIYDEEALSVDTFDVYGVDDIPEITGVSFTRGADVTSHELEVSWTVSNENDASAWVDIYLTEDKDILEKLRTDNATEQDIESVTRIKLDSTASGSKTVVIPDTFENGNYYVAAMLANSAGGISTAISTDRFEFKNAKLPGGIESAEIRYAGNGEIYVEITDPEDLDYTHYLVEIVADDGTTVEGALEQFAVGEDVFVGKYSSLSAGTSYHIEITTLNETEDNYFYGSDIYKTASMVMPEIDKPVLLSVGSNIEGSTTGEGTLKLTYKFDRPVWMYSEINNNTYTANDFKDTWELTHELYDGDYTVGFTAYGLNKDSVTGKDFPNIANATMGFSVDTKAPSLSVRSASHKALDNAKTISTFGSNVVFTDADGNFTVEGVTDHSATLTAEGNAVEVGNNGSFTYNGKLNSGETEREILLRAEDEAGNYTELYAFAVLGDRPVIETVAILNNGNKIPKNSDGEAVVNLKNGDDITLTLMGYTKDGKEVEIEEPVWDILYERNIIEFNEGKIIAKATGETAVKAGIFNGVATLADNSFVDLLTEDYVVIKISANSKDDLASAIEEAEESIASPENASQIAIEVFRASIDAAKAVYEDTEATATEIANATTTLKNAIRSFENEKNAVINPGGGNFGGTVGGTQTLHSVIVAPTENGKVSVSQTAVYTGNSLTVAATPDEGYEVESVLVNGKNYGSNRITTVAAVRSNVKITVTFRRVWANPFIDVSADDWFYEYVRWANENGIMNGVSENTFSTNSPLTRAMLVTILWRNEGSPAAGASGFEDVSSDSYYAQAVAWAKANGIVNGYSEVQFAPNDNILREQIAAIMHRYAAYKGYDVSAANGTSLEAYADSAMISEYAVASMKYAVGTGLVNGRTSTTLDPKGNATRAESATILQRFVTANK